MNDLDDRLSRAVKRRDELSAEVQRIEGRLEAARSTLSSLEDECRSKGVEPDQLGATIEQLQKRYKELVEKLEQDVASADEALTPFLKETAQ